MSDGDDHGDDHDHDHDHDHERDGNGDDTAESSVAPTWRPATGLIALVLAVVALAGLMAGSGVSPREVADGIRELASGEATIDILGATVVAFDEAESRRVELWMGPTTDGDGQCRFVRTLSAATGIVDGDVACVDGSMLPWSDPEFEIAVPSQYFGFVSETAIGSSRTAFDAVALSGSVHPSITAMTARFGDGAEYSFVPDPQGGWFAVILPAEISDISSEDGALVNVLVELELFDAEGRVLTTVDVAAWRLATAG